MHRFSEKNLILKHFEKHPDIRLILSGIVVGLAGGYGAIAFRWLINIFQNFFYGDFGDPLRELSDDQFAALLRQVSDLRILLIPIVGGLIVGPLNYLWAREAKGHGVPEVMEAVALKGGMIRKRLSVVKALGSSISIASGGSVGREGPIVQIGASLGSAFGQLAKFRKEDLKTMVGCGAAAGIAATFNAPIAGVFFALEVIMADFKIKAITPIVISSVIATVVSHFYLGNTPSFLVPTYTLVSVWEFPIYAVLGVLSAFVGLGFILVLYKAEDLFDRFRAIPEYLKPCVGGAIIGVIGLFCVEVYGVGYDSINLALKGKMALQMLLLLLIMKALATAITLGSGGSGGVFAPSLFLGAMVGGVVGHAANHLFPAITADPGAYSLVGMGCVVAATTHAPISAIIILFEMTNTYAIILPLMLSCVVSVTFIRFLKRESIYTIKLIRRGVDLGEGMETKMLRSISVQTVMHRKYEIVREDMSLEEFMRLIPQSGHVTYPVVTREGKLYGIISLPDFQDYVTMGYITRFVLVKEVAESHFLTLMPQHNLLDALRILGSSNAEQIPVLSKDGELEGMLSREDLLRAYYQALQPETGTEAAEKTGGESPAVNGFPQNLIVEDLQGASMEEAVDELLAVLSKTDVLQDRDIEGVKKQVLEREALASTVIAEGFAAPHARLENLSDVVAVFGYSRQGIAFGSEGGPVHSILLFLSPLHRPKAHLDFLRYLGVLLQREGVLASLTTCGDRAALAGILNEIRKNAGDSSAE